MAVTKRHSPVTGTWAANLALVGLVVVLVLDPARPAHAYLDPGTGSILLQLLLGGVAGGLVILKLYWQRFKSLFGRGEAMSPSDVENKEAQ